jgi:2-polyprenyl-3-methyl-5-hydroxy-6-metoxy-1,4-benzoquinol methylase
MQLVIWIERLESAKRYASCLGGVVSNHQFGRGKPADLTEYIVSRRVLLLQRIEGFMRQDADLLDIGCGNGATLLRLAGYYRQCHGIDISKEAGERFLAEARRRGLSNCSFSVDDIDRMEPAGRTFDRIICFEVLEHVENDLQAVMMIHQLLGPGGMAAITVPNKWWIFETHGAYLPYLPWNRIPFFSWLPTRIHERFAKARIYTVERLTKLLGDAGFHIVDVFYVTAPMDRIAWAPLQNALRRTLFSPPSTSIPFLSASMMAIVSQDTN